MEEISESPKEVTEGLRAYFQTRPEVALGYLFGSRATGKANALSDFDVAVLIDPGRPEGRFPYGYRARLSADLMAVVGSSRVDLVILNDAPIFLRHRVISTGRAAYVRSEAERVRFESAILGRYPDVKRLWAAHGA